jgi:rRNA processing protein Gar1
MFIYNILNVVGGAGSYSVTLGEQMKVLGTVQEVTSDGKLVIKAAFAPQLKARIVDNRKRPLGTVRRVFGPVVSPYVSIEPAGDLNLLATLGKHVYVEEVENYGKGKRRDR